LTVSLRTKVTAITSGIIAVVLLISGIIYYNSIHNYATENIYKRALSISQVGQALIDGDTLQGIVELKDKEDQDYKEVKDILAILMHLAELGEVFAIGINGEDLIYLSEGVKDNLSLSYEHIPKEQFEKVLHTLEIGETFFYKDYYDAYTGKMLKGVLLPILNSKQELVGIIGYNVEKNHFYSELYLVKWVIILGTTMSILACILLNYFSFRTLLKPIDYLIKIMNKVAKGDFKIKIDDRYKDEVGKIIKKFIENCERISQILNHITVSSTNLRFVAEKILGVSKRNLVAFEEVVNSTREISLISYEQVDKREEAKLAITYLEEDLRIILSEVKEKGCQVCEGEKLIEIMATHISTIKKKLYELDRVFEIIDKHTVKLAEFTEKQMALSQEFAAMAEELNQEAEGLNESALSIKIQ